MVGNEPFGVSLKRFVSFLFDPGSVFINLLFFGKCRIYDYHILNADLWIIEAFNKDGLNPEGFRTACKLAGLARILLLFHETPSNFPPEGDFWCNPLNCKFDDKIMTLFNIPIPVISDFEILIKQWQDLAYEPNAHKRRKCLFEEGENENAYCWTKIFRSI